MCALVLGVGATHVEIASADSVPSARPVHVERNGCDAARPGEIASILRVELLGRLLEGPTRADAYRVTIDCSGDDVEISVGLPDESSKSTRTELTGAPANIRSRIIALATAELVRDLDREPLRIPPPDRSRSESGDELKPPVRDPGRPIDLGAFGQTGGFPGHGLWLAGGGLRFDYACRVFCVGFDAALLTTTEHFAQGTAQVFLSYASPYVAWRHAWARTEMLLGAGYALGAARLIGRAADARVVAGTTTGPWSATYALAVLALSITGDLSVEARGQVGWVTLPVIGEVSGGADVALRDLWASFQAGLAITL